MPGDDSGSPIGQVEEWGGQWVLSEHRSRVSVEGPGDDIGSPESGRAKGRTLDPQGYQG